MSSDISELFFQTLTNYLYDPIYASNWQDISKDIPYECDNITFKVYIKKLIYECSIDNVNNNVDVKISNNNDSEIKDRTYYITELLWRILYMNINKCCINSKNIIDYLQYNPIIKSIKINNIVDINDIVNEIFHDIINIQSISEIYSNPRKYYKYVCYQCGALNATYITEADVKLAGSHEDYNYDEFEVSETKSFNSYNTECKCSLIGNTEEKSLKSTTENSIINLLPLCLPNVVNYLDIINQFTIISETVDNLIIIKGLMCNLLTTKRDLSLLWKPMPQFIIPNSENFKFYQDNLHIISEIFNIIIENADQPKPINEIELYCDILYTISHKNSVNITKIKHLYLVVRHAILNFMKFKFVKTSLISPELNIYEIINNSNEHKEKFNLAVNDYLFHGSPLENWYPIMYNGLKNASGTSLQLNGAAYGNGIYMADDINTSIGYCNPYHLSHIKNKYYTNINGKEISGIIGIFQVLKPKKEYLNTYYVIPNENDCILRYIILVDSITVKYATKINSYFTELQYSIEKLKPETVEDAVKQALSLNISVDRPSSSSIKVLHKANMATSSATKRIMKEIEILHKSSNQILSTKSQSQSQSIKYDVDYGDNVYLITVKMYAENFKDSKKLFDQMAIKKIDFITVEIILSDQYPFSPPFLRVVKPIFKHLTGHITLGGSICHEILSPTGWTATTKLLQLLEFIVTEINQGKPELDMETRKTEYGLDEAQDAYRRMLSSHGWN